MVDAAFEEQLRRRGLTPLSADVAVEALQRALDHDVATVTVADVDWARFAPSFAAVRAGSLFRELPEVRALDASTEAAASVPEAAALLDRLRSVSERERHRQILAIVAHETASVLGHADAARIDPRRGFAALGLDSLMAVELRRRLQRRTGVALDATVTFDHPTPEDVAARVRDLLEPGLGGTARSAEEGERDPAPREADGHEPIAIVGVGLRLPGGVVDLDGLWTLLAKGLDTVRPIPEERWDVGAFYDPDPDAKGKSYVRSGAFLDDVAGFDAAFFGISPREAAQIDPQHRLLLEAAFWALEDAGVPPSSLKNSATGVFVGVGPSDYGVLQGKSGATEAYGLTGTHTSFAAGRLAFTLGLQGPALSIDTACSSSLVALHVACQALRRGERE